MKAVAAALVLIAGAAVVLWYGNTLNSWVLGGLIGGLAALLLSIPISLTLFSYFSRRHDERLRAEAEEVSLAQVHYYDDYPEMLPPRRSRRGYVVPSYSLEPDPVQVEVEDYYQDEPYYQDQDYQEEQYDYYGPRQSRHVQHLSPLPAPQRLPAPGARQRRASRHLPAVPQESSASVVRSSQRDAASGRGKEFGEQRSKRRLYYSGFPGYEPGSVHHHHRSAALRAARMEAARRHEDDDILEELPTNTSRRLPPSLRASRSLAEQNQHFGREQRAGRQQRRTVEGISSHSAPYQGSLPAEGESSASQPDLTFSRSAERETEYLQDRNLHYPQTGPIRSSTRTGSLGRNPQVDGLPLDSTRTTDNLNRPLVRKAPYVYEDDPLWQEFAQQVDAPAVRRSSRLDATRRQDEDEAR
jgi:hypothetical protein